MPNKATKYLLAGAAFMFATAASSQDQPLSVIDWVKRHPDQPAMTSVTIPKKFEPPVAPNALAPNVTVRTLDEPARQIIGLVPAQITGLPENLWSGSSAYGLEAQFDALPPIDLPAAQALLYTLLLTEANGPGSNGGTDGILTLARVDALERLGAHDPALALLEQAGVAKDPAHFSAYMDLALLTGQEDTACAILATNPHLAPSMGHRIFCTARLGDWPTAALLFDTAETLNDLPLEQSAALERFLHPEAFEESPPLSRPENMTPLLFRVHEAVGEPLPTRSLPRAYAVADLRDLAGWKTQLDAAERLAATGALPANRLLGLYTARQPAASGGVWDRVRAVQRFETALRTRSKEAIAKTLPAAWEAMASVGLETAFSDFFADALHRYELGGTAGRIALTMMLLSPDYQEVTVADELLVGIAHGRVENLSSTQPLTDAVLQGFDTANARRDLADLARNGRMGEATLRALVLLEEGNAGDLNALTQALATLRLLGQEDTVRRAALQVLLLDRTT